ncbi:hypothetical protein Scep_027909 [Stephania cephalantha]|uniref:Uncharacterized protein n=1 Tax=Stephania cephalantha TaxID=152367 RepID=A0AAP0HL93_9MAGN
MAGGGKIRSSQDAKGKAQLVEKPKQISKAPPKPIRPTGILANNPQNRAPREPSPPLSFEYDLEGEEEIEKAPTISFHAHNLINAKTIARTDSTISKNMKIIPERDLLSSDVVVNS